MLDAMIAHYTSGNKAKFAALLGVSAQTISAWGARNTFDSELIYTKCVGLSSEWLLTGEGPMLRDNKISEDNKCSSAPITMPISQSSDTVALRLMEKLDGKDAKIEQLQNELRMMSEELGKLKAQLGHYQPENKIHQLEAGDLGGKKTAKDASLKKHSSQNADDVTSVIVP